MSFTRLASTVAILLGSISITTALSQSFTLAYAYKAGTSYQYKRTESTTGFAQTQKGQTAELNRTAETYITLAVEKSGPDITYRYEQDTTLVDDRSPQPNPGPDFLNVLTKKPVRIEMTDKGDLRSATLLSPLDVSAFPFPVDQNAFARAAMILPPLPRRTLAVGDGWTETKGDTTYPSMRVEGLGNGSGLRYNTIGTVYSVDSIVQVAGYSCIKISWHGKTLSEGKTIFPAREIFTEETTAITGTLYFAPAEGVLVRMTVHTDRENTTAAFAKESEIVPSSSSTDMTLTLLPS